MKIEHFPIEAIPESYRVFDVDLTPSGEPVVLVGHESDPEAPAYARIGSVSIRLPTESIQYGRPISAAHHFYVRALGDKGIVAVQPRARSDDEVNGWIWNATGRREAEFHAGHNVEEVLANEDCILLFHGDEGQTGDVSLSHEAMAVMSRSGAFLWGHRTQFPDRHMDTWFHCAAWGNPAQALIVADFKRTGWHPLEPAACAFAKLDVSERSQDVCELPSPIKLPGAATLIDDGLVLRVPPEGASRWVEGMPFDLVQWEPGSPDWRVVGSVPYDRSTPFRGLPGGRFIAVKPDGYEIMTFP